MKKCPKCNDASLSAKTLKSKNIELDLCNSCKGLWFDNKELDVILGIHADKNFTVPSFAIQNPKVLCPICHEGLYEFCYPNTMVLIDACKHGHGVWLDNNEWKEITTARDVKNQVVCPNCHTKQKNTGSCEKCGLVFQKHPSGQQSGQQSTIASKQQSKTKNDRTRAQKAAEKDFKMGSYADEIPGLKGQLLRFIDKTINRLSNF